MLRYLLPALVATAMVVPAAHADSNADEADLRFRRGTTLFKAGKYDEALLEFFASNRLAHNRNVIFNIARSYEALGRHEEAYRYYAEYIDEETVPAEKTAAQAKLAELAPRVALLKIESTPPGATVYLERKDLGGRGETPLVIAVAAGDQVVILEREGYRPQTTTVRAERGKQTPVVGSLELIVGTLRVDSRPPAKIFVDRAAGAPTPPSGTTPASLALTPGRHTVELEADAHRTQRTDVVITADVETRLSAALEARPPPSGTVVLASKSAGALVLVDGVASGFTPAVLELPVGRHEIEVRADRARVWRRRVDVVVDARVFLDVELEDAEEEVTGATRSVQTVSTAPASVTLLQREEIWAFGYQRLTEAVSAARGLYTSDDRNYEAIGIRGFSRPGDFTNRVLFIRDGHVMNDDWIGSAAVGRDFAADLDDIDRIEVIRGPGSTFYGPGAFFGVIQVVSQEPGAGAPVRAGGALDSLGGGTAFARGSTTAGPASVSLYASAYDSAGQTLRFKEFDGAARDTDGEDAQRGSARARAGEFEFDASLTRRRKDVPTAPYETLFDPTAFPGAGGEATNTIDRRGYAEGRWTHRRGFLGISARAAYDYQQYDGVYMYDDGAGGAYPFTDAGGGDWWTGELRLSFEGDWQKFTVGGEVAHHAVTQSYDDFDDTTDDLDDERTFVNSSAYAVWELNFRELAAISLGGRFDAFGEQEDSAFSPRLGAVLHPYAGGTTKLVAGTAFRSPSTYELYYNDGGLTQVAPGSLDPETIWTGEVEHTHTLGPRTYLIGSVFGSRIQDLISLAENEDEILVFVNSDDDVTAVGGELELRLTHKKGAWVAVAGSATQLESDDEAVEVNSAAVVGALRGFLPILGDRLVLAASLTYNGERRRRDGRHAPQAVLGRLFASGRVAGERLWYRVGVTNALDWDWSVPVGEEYLQQAIPQDRRTVHGQLVYQFD